MPDITHYWPFINDTIDIIGKSNLTASKPTMSSDRFNNQLNAIRVSNISNFLTAPPNIYFYSVNSTLTAWIKLSSCGQHSRLIDFGNGPNTNNIFLCISYELSCKLSSAIHQGNNVLNFVVSPFPFDMGNWYHIAAVYTGSNVKLFINGSLVAQGATYPINVSNRTISYVGRSQWEFNGDQSINLYKNIKKFK